MIVGRQVERAFADIVISEVVAGSPRTLVVRGVPGIGKSALLGHLVARARHDGFEVLVGRAGEGDRHRPFGVLSRLLDEPCTRAGPLRAAVDRIAAVRPVLLVFDDLHRADRWTSGVVEELMARPPSGPVLLAVALRPNGPGSNRPGPKGPGPNGPAERPADHIELGPFPDADAHCLLAAVPDPALRGRIVAAAGGNPAHLLRLGRQAGRARTAS